MLISWVIKSAMLKKLNLNADVSKPCRSQLAISRKGLSNARFFSTDANQSRITPANSSKIHQETNKSLKHGKQKPQVLIVGAGPTGLNLALQLTHFGIPVRIIDKNPQLDTTSRALAVHARTLEFYRQLGIADEAVKKGFKVHGTNLLVNGKKAARINFGDFGQGLSEYPYITILPQDVHEIFLIEKLSELGVSVDRHTELLDFKENQNVSTRLRKADGSEEICEFEYIGGCDGARSTVRKLLQINFSGDTYKKLYYVADVEIEGANFNNDLHVAMDEGNFLGIFPIHREGRVRLVGVASSETEANSAKITWDDVSHDVITRLQIQVKKVNWFSTYHAHHRVADKFRIGRAFLLGDAAHIHSPVGGQGMNTGIGDAVNLSWKLAAVLKKKAAPHILDTYESERATFAHKMVNSTDKAFTFMDTSSYVAKEVRQKFIPLVMPMLLKINIFREFVFQTLSQIGISYRESSSLSEGHAGKIHGGDRLPWLRLEGNSTFKDNFQPLLSMDWQVHIYGQATLEFTNFCKENDLTLTVFPWNESIGKTGLLKNSVYLIRPDGYIGWTGTQANRKEIEHYIDKFDLRTFKSNDEVEVGSTQSFRMKP